MFALCWRFAVMSVYPDFDMLFCVVLIAARQMKRFCFCTIGSALFLRIVSLNYGIYQNSIIFKKIVSYSCVIWTTIMTLWLYTVTDSKCHFTVLLWRKYMKPCRNAMCFWFMTSIVCRWNFAVLFYLMDEQIVHTLSRYIKCRRTVFFVYVFLLVLKPHIK